MPDLLPFTHALAAVAREVRDRVDKHPDVDPAEWPAALGDLQAAVEDVAAATFALTLWANKANGRPAAEKLDAARTNGYLITAASRIGRDAERLKQTEPGI